MLRIAVRLEHIGDVGVDSTIVTLSRVLVISVAFLMKRPPTDLTRTLTRDWFHA